MTRVIGLISGTSVDGIDAALVEIDGFGHNLQVNFIAGEIYPYPQDLRSQILSVCAGESLSMADLAALDDAIAYHFAQAALALQSKHPPIALIGSHGQTVYHRPPNSQTLIPHPPLDSPLGYSLQLGRGAAIAHLTQIPTVSNFRSADIAAGGQGAPLVPAIDVCLLSHPTLTRCIQNLGGIGNVAYLPPRSTSHTPVLGWDTGPGNALLDLAVQHLSNRQLTYDKDGAWAAQGTPYQPLIEQWLQHDFFHQPPPKSTGRELFGQEYLDRCLADVARVNLSAADTLATLTELTAASIAHSYQTFLPTQPDQVLLCGGGSHNLYLKQRIQQRLLPIPVLTTDEVGLNSNFKEAIAFAILAYWRMQGVPGNLPEVTGARQAVLLGEINLVA